MGVPKFYRFISERYPLINNKVVPGSAPRIDYLYLDMNGIIHNCARGSAGNGGLDSKRYISNAPVVKTKTQIFLDVFKYIDNLFALAPPTKLLYMAIDGVAPRAKMNQQRARRFRSAKERADEHQRLSDEDPMYAAVEQEPFDSNCITPGTEFMQELSAALRYFVAKKITEDRQWADIDVVLSGAEAPGEGEHKIMEYIRAIRESGNLAANNRHCVYGLDADLIMLGLVTHEPHFFILREKIDYSAFWKKKGGPRVATSLDTAAFGEFEFLSIGILREYLVLELGAKGNSTLPFFDVERIMDDFIFILMLIGNDFLPNLPTLDIADGTLNVVLHLYRRVLPIMGGYLTRSGGIVPERLEFFFAKLGMLDKSVMRGKLEVEEQLSRGRRRSIRNTAVQNVDLDGVFGFAQWNGTAALARPVSLNELRDRAVNIRKSVQDAELLKLKKSYYADKLGSDFLANESSGLNALTQSYVEGVWWTLRYYTEGCGHWRWYYPYHYAPFASDISDVAAKLTHYEKATFVADKPFRPLEQLLSVLPPVSSWCLPKPYRALMTSASSPIHDQYPTEFGIDMNGKRNDWEAIVLLPFVNERRLLRAIASVPIKSLSKEEVQRNNHGPSFIYKHNVNFEEQVLSPFSSQLPSFISKAKRRYLSFPEIKFRKPFTSKLLPGTLSPCANKTLEDLPFLGTFKHSSSLDAVGINVFGTPSRSESILLEMDFVNGGMKDLALKESGSKTLLEQQALQIDRPVWAGYPWRTAGVIESIENRSITRQLASGEGKKEAAGRTTEVVVKQTNRASFERDVGIIVSAGLQRSGVILSPPTEIARIRLLSHGGTMVVQDESESSVSMCDMHFVRPRTVPSPSQAREDLEYEQLSVGQPILFMGSGPYFGQMGKVRSLLRTGMVKVEFMVSVAAAREPAFGYRVVSISSNVRWLTLSKLASMIGVSAAVVDAFLGSVRVRLQSGKEEVDLGLGIKYIGRGLLIPGYARRDERQHFSFSEKTADLMHRYRKAFPHLFTTIERCKAAEAKAANGRPRGNTVYNTRDLFGISKKSDDAAKAASTWISVQEVAKLPLVSADSQVLPKDAVAELEKHGSIVLALQKEYEGTLGRVDVSKKTREVSRQSLLTGGEGVNWFLEQGNASFRTNARVAADGSGLRLGDRVVNRVGVGGVPFGLRGTVVGIHPPAALSAEGLSVGGSADRTVSALVEVVFDEGFISGSTLSGRCTPGHGKAVPAPSLFIVRPDRENQFYVKHYARMAAKTAASMKRNPGGSSSHDARSLAIEQASVLSYAGVVRKKVTVAQPTKTVVVRAPVSLPLAVPNPVVVGSSAPGATQVKLPVINTSSLPVPTFVNGNKEHGNGWDRSQWRGEEFVARLPRSGEPVQARRMDTGGRSVDEASREAARMTELLKRDLGIVRESVAKRNTGREAFGEPVNGHDGVLPTKGSGEKDDLVTMWEELQREEAKQRGSSEAN